MPIPAVIECTDNELPAREKVLTIVRNWIVDGDLAPGEIIRDAEIARALNVSRTPVREALLQLRTEALVEMKPKGWTQVRLLDQREAEKLLPVVTDLEALAARLAAGNPCRDLSEADIAGMRAGVVHYVELAKQHAKAAAPAGRIRSHLVQ